MPLNASNMQELNFSQFSDNTPHFQYKSQHLNNAQ